MRKPHGTNPLEGASYPQPPKTLTLRMRLATPMIGGGAVAGRPDPHYPIRASEIRGHLRFWWRARHAHEYASVQELHAAESALFGRAGDEDGGASPFPIHVRAYCEPRLVRLDKCDGQNGRPRIPPYVRALLHQELTQIEKEIDRANPVRGDDAQKNRARQQRRNLKQERSDEIEAQKDTMYPLVVPSGFEFDLVIEGWTPEAILALKDWIRFGGIGARTHRGCGSVTVTEPAELAALCRWPRNLRDLQLAGNLANPIVPSVVAAVALIGPRCATSSEAWHEAVALYQFLRKSQPAVRATKKYVPDRDGRGRWQERALGEEPTFPQRGIASHSLWPEKEAALYAEDRGDYPRDDYESFESAFPRAHLGMPISFHYQGGDPPRPTDFDLSPKQGGKGRYGSPLIVRAVELANGWYPVWVLLNAPAPSLQGYLHWSGRGADTRVELEWKGVPEDVALEEHAHTLRDTIRQYCLDAGWTEVV